MRRGDKKEKRTWATTLNFMPSGLLFLTALIWCVGALLMDQSSLLLIAVIWLCLGIVFLSLGLAGKKK
jgi:hypothetical protein